MLIVLAFPGDSCLFFFVVQYVTYAYLLDLPLNLCFLSYYLLFTFSVTKANFCMFAL